jgi:uncharacterized Zn finger protein (UPF0148 family)
MPKSNCAKCEEPMAKKASFCPNCGAKRKKAEVLLSEDELSLEKTLRKLRVLEEKLSDFNQEFSFSQVETLTELTEFPELSKSMLSLQKQLSKMSNLSDRYDVDDLIATRFPQLVEELREFQVTLETLSDSYEEDLSDQEEYPGEIESPSGTSALKFHLIYWPVATVASAIPAALLWEYFDRQSWIFYVAISVGLYISFLVFRRTFIKCPNCGLYVSKKSSLERVDFLGSEDGWHTESEAVTTHTDYSNNSSQSIGSSSSTSYVNRNVPHTDYYYLEVYRCSSCGDGFTVNTSQRVDG